MYSFFQKKIVIPVIATAFIFVATSFKDDFFETAKQIEIFTTLFKELNKNYVDQTNPGDLMDKAIKGMLASLDPYTVYFNEQDVLRFKINSTGEYTGIGAMLTRKKDQLVIKEVYKDFPADKAGLKPGDQITQIGDVKIANYQDEVSNLFKGAKNTKIELRYLRQGKENATQIILDEVEIKSVPFFAKIDEKTGYIVLARFNKKASQETKEALEQLKKQGAERIILDVRDNPGGLLHEAVNICNLFVAKNETIVTTKSKIDKHNTTYKTVTDPIDTQIPLVIIVNERSASASEIVSGALQDLDRAVVLGSRSFGKGLVQRPVNLTYGTQLKVTISRYYTPSGRCIQALDYSKKDVNGQALKTEQKNYNAFKTRKGRIVYDGGGIQPDIEMEEAKLSPITHALLRNDAIFNYVTSYCYKNSGLGNTIPTISESDYLDFKHDLRTQGFAFDTETELALKNTWALAKKEKLDQAIQLEYQQLLVALQKTENSLLDKNQKEIKKLMVDEIIKQFQYQEGLYRYNILNDTEIKKATTLLSSKAAYNAVLKL